jgi:hypothetical protein
MSNKTSRSKMDSNSSDNTIFCTVQVKTMKGEILFLYDLDVNSTVRDLYQRIEPLETTTPDGKWKLMMTFPTVKTFKINDMDKKLSDYKMLPNQTYKVEVILDMGACHTTCKRI